MIAHKVCVGGGEGDPFPPGRTEDADCTATNQVWIGGGGGAAAAAAAGCRLEKKINSEAEEESAAPA